jgi:hypothetical protein
MRERKFPVIGHTYPLTGIYVSYTVIPKAQSNIIGAVATIIIANNNVQIIVVL